MEYEWVFERDGERLIVQRWRRPDRVWELTVIWPSGEAETEGYLDTAALGDVHARLERELARSGWMLLEFRPERRRRTHLIAEAMREPATDRRKLGRLAPLRPRADAGRADEKRATPARRPRTPHHSRKSR